MSRLALQFEGTADEVRPLLEKYDPQRDEWDFRQDSDFWLAIREAQKHGHRGQGVRIAIIDGAFDLTRPKLQAQSSGAIPAWAEPEADRTHGTAVALLVSTVAPDATLDLYEVLQEDQINEALLFRALDLASTSQATLVNLSIGSPISHFGWWERLRNREGHCELCRAASQVAAHGKLLLAAAGNAAEEMFCPAREPSVLGIGFQTEARQIILTGEGGFTESAMWQPPSYPQAFVPDFTLVQPPGVLGTSYATPLLTGALALMDASTDAPRFLGAVQVGATADFLLGLLKNVGLDQARELFPRLYQAALEQPYKSSLIRETLQQAGSPDALELLANLYLAALNLLPHRHFGPPAGPPCVACSLFAQTLYINGGLFFLESGRLDLALEWLTTARWLAPWSPHAAANLATAQRVQAVARLRQEGPTPAALALLQAARDHYLAALELSPQSPTYLSGLDLVNQLLAAL